MRLKDDKRQKNQLELAFTDEGRSEAPRATAEGSESFLAKPKAESPAIGEQLMEEVCERENCKQAMARVKANKGSPRDRRNDGRRTPGTPQTTLASDTGTAVARNLRTTTGEAGGNPQAGRRGAKAWHPHGSRELHKSSVRIWDGRRSDIRIIRFAASGWKSSSNVV